MGREIPNIESGIFPIIETIEKVYYKVTCFRITCLRYEGNSASTRLQFNSGLHQITTSRCLCPKEVAASHKNLMHGDPVDQAEGLFDQLPDSQRLHKVLRKHV